MDKILFIIYQDQIRFVPNKAMSCKEYYISLGGDMMEYHNLIRGMIMDDKLIFMKSDFSYDDEVIKIAKKCAPIIMEQLNMPNLITCCGIDQMGNRWRPSIVFKDGNYVPPKKEVELNEEQKELMNRTQVVEAKTEGQLFDYKNNYDDPLFAKYASRFSLYLLIATIIVKVVLYYQHNLDIYNRFIALIVFLQIFFLILSIFGYRKRKKITRFYGLCATGCLFLLMNLPDIIIGAINLFFTIDQTYIVKFLAFFHRRKKRKV